MNCGVGKHTFFCNLMTVVHFFSSNPLYLDRVPSSFYREHMVKLENIWSSQRYTVADSDSATHHSTPHSTAGGG